MIGYGRVSTGGQHLDRQIRALTEAGCVRIFADKKSDKNAEREELWKVLDYLRPGDTLVVPSLDRLGRSLQDLISIVAGLRKRGIGFRSLHEALDTTTPGGRLVFHVFHVFAALAEFIRELIVEGTREGLAAARARGQRLGRPPAMTPEQVRHARALLAQPDATIARLLGVSRATIYKYVPELSAGGRPAIEPPPAHVELVDTQPGFPVVRASEPAEVDAQPEDTSAQ
ncbi:MAG: recombinase family protein [Actinoallomurus sp.]